MKTARWPNGRHGSQIAETAAKEWSPGARKTECAPKWQKRLFETAQAQQEKHFVEVTPAQPMSSGGIAVTIRIGSAEAAIHNGAAGTTVEMVLRALRSC